MIGPNQGSATSDSTAETVPTSRFVSLLSFAGEHTCLTLTSILAFSVLLSSAFAITKRPWCDEAWFASPAYNLIVHGTMSTTILDAHGFAYAHNLKGLDHFTYWIMPAYPIAQALWYKIVGFSLFGMRSLSILWSVVALLSWFRIVRWITGSRGIALLTVLLLGTEQQFVRIAGFGRMDMMCMALGTASLALYLSLRETRFSLALATGACLAGLAVFTHPNGLFYALISGGFVLWLDRRRVTIRNLLVGFLPIAVLSLLWLHYVLRAPDLFFAQMGSQSAFFTFPVHFARTLSAEVSQRYATPYSLTAPLPMVIGSIVLYAYVLAIITSLIVPELHRNPACRTLLLLVAFQFVLLLCVKKSWYYLVHIVPFYTALLAVAAHWLWSKSSRWRTAIALVLACIVTIDIGFILARVHRYDRRQYQQVAEYLKRNVPPKNLIMGSGELGFVVGFDGQILDDARLGFLSGKIPDFVVIDPQYETFWFPWLKEQEPAAYIHVTDILQNYNLVYEQTQGGSNPESSNWHYRIFRKPTLVTSRNPMNGTTTRN